MADSETAPAAPSPATGRLALGATLLFLILLVTVVGLKRQMLGSLGFLRDEAYLNLVVSSHLVNHGFYGAAGEAVPATQDTLWRLLIAGCDWLCDDLSSAPYLLGAATGLLLLAAVLGLARHVGRGTTFSALAVLLAILGTALPLDSMSGLASVLATLLMTLAFSLHVRSFHTGRSPLSLGSAFLLGLAALVRVDFAAVWVALALHAVVLCLLWRAPGRNALVVLIRSLSGGVIIAIVLAPVLWWNMRVIGVPWPRFADAPLALDAVTADAGALRAQVVHLMGEALRQGWSWLQGQSPFLQGLPERLFFWLGSIVLVVDAARRPERRPLTGLLAVLLVPLVISPLYPYIGTSSHFALWRSLQPVEVLLAAYGVLRLADGITVLLDRSGRIVQPFVRTVVPVLLVGAFVVLNGASRNVRNGWAARNQLRQQMESRERVAAQLKELGAAPSAILVTDSPGWLLAQGATAVVDLSGQVTPQVLAYLGAGGAWDLEALRHYVNSRGATALVLWNPDASGLAARLGCPAGPADAAAPRVCALSPSAAP